MSRTTEYLDALYRKCDRGQVVLIGPSRDYVSGYFDVTRLDLVQQHIEKYPRDLFIKVNVMDHKKSMVRKSSAIGGKAEVMAIVSFHLDVDAGKDDRYLTRTRLLEALDAMPLAPSMLIQTDGDSAGFHAYWLLDEPHYITDDEDRQRCQDISTRWLAELREHAKPGTIDGTADICRYLRPVGSIRESGNSVKPVYIDADRRYKISDFVLPALEQPKVEYNAQPRDDSELPIGEYLDAAGLNSVEAILSEQGYEPCRGQKGFWIRSGSKSGAPTGEIFTTNGKRGFTVKSGAADPLSCINKTGGTGNWYSLEALFVSFHTKKDAHRDKQAWSDTAKFCREYLDSQKPKVSLDHLLENEKTNEEKEQDETSTISAHSGVLSQNITHAAVEILDAYLSQIRSGDLPQLVPQHPALEGIEVGYGLLCVLGAPPGAGKTALAMQIAYDAMELDETLQVIVANAEMSFQTLLRRELVRRTRLDSDAIRFGKLTAQDHDTITRAAEDIRKRLMRVRVVEECNLLNLAALRNESPALIIVDYLQKFAPADKDVRQGVNQVAATLRTLCKCGHAVLALSATKRDVNGKHSANELSLSSFKESGEIEFNADSAYVLKDVGPLEKDWLRHMTLACVKNRHGRQIDFELKFHKPRMEFSKFYGEAAPIPEFCSAFGGDDE